MKIRIGETMTLPTRRIRVDSFISAGTEGEVYKTVDTRTHATGALKVFNNHMPPGDRLKRIQFLVGERLDTTCSALCPPTDYLRSNGLVGHYSTFIDGHSLEDYLAQPDNSIFENVKLAIAVAHSIAVLHARNIAHGDVHLQNFVIVRTATGFELKTIDFDNFSKPGLPAPACVGHDLFMAPELRNAVNNKRVAIPDIFSDCYALACVLHVLLLAKHPASGADGDRDQFDQTMTSGIWHQDPMLKQKDGDGYPVTILNADLMRLFRRALSLSREERPSAANWTKALHQALFQIYVHDECGGPVFTDTSKIVCPFCHKPYSLLKLVFTSPRQEIPLHSGSVPIGRGALLSPKVSAHHAVCRRVGPETFLESVGTNGTYRWSGRGWLKLPDNQPVLIQSGDRLRFADVECHVKETS